jgi:hypothetical protein
MCGETRSIRAQYWGFRSAARNLARKTPDSGLGEEKASIHPQVAHKADIILDSSMRHLAFARGHASV